MTHGQDAVPRTGALRLRKAPENEFPGVPPMTHGQDAVPRTEALRLRKAPENEFPGVPPMTHGQDAVPRTGALRLRKAPENEFPGYRYWLQSTFFNGLLGDPFTRSQARGSNR
jgi:hypothetical protein